MDSLDFTQDVYKASSFLQASAMVEWFETVEGRKGWRIWPTLEGNYLLSQSQEALESVDLSH